MKSMWFIQGTIAHSQKTVPGLSLDRLKRNAAILKYGVDCQLQKLHTDANLHL